MINDNGRHAAASGPAAYGVDRRNQRGEPASAARARRLLATLAAAAAVASACLVSPVAIDAASAQRVLQITGAKRTATVLVPVGKTEDVRDRRALHRHHGRRSGSRRRRAAHRPRDLGARQEDRHDPRHGLCRGQAPGRHLRHRGVLRRVAPRDRDRPRRRSRHQGLVGQRPHHAVGHRARTRSRSTAR